MKLAIKLCVLLTSTASSFSAACRYFKLRGILRASFSPVLEIRLLCTNVPLRITQKIIDRFYSFKNYNVWLYLLHSMFWVSRHRGQKTGCCRQLSRKNWWKTWCRAPKIISKSNQIIKKKIRSLRRRQNSSQYVGYQETSTLHKRTKTADQKAAELLTWFTFQVCNIT